MFNTVLACGLPISINCVTEGHLVDAFLLSDIPFDDVLVIELDEDDIEDCLATN
jgi:hypothetical protein